jgi:uncharacterized protein YcnI
MRTADRRCCGAFANAACQAACLITDERTTNLKARPPIATRLALTVSIVGAVALLAPAAVSAHARISPAVSVKGELQLYSLAVPTEKSNATTTKIVMKVPSGFGIDSFVPPPPGWTQHVRQSGSGEDSVVTEVTWTGGRTPTGQDSLFQFLAQPASAKTYTFLVQQTYSDGSIVNWSGSESSDAPAPAIEVKDSLGGSSGLSTLAIVALVVAVLALVAAGFALIGGGRSGRGEGRPLA